MKKSLLVLFLSLSVGLLHAQDMGTLSEAKISFTFVSKKVKGTLSGFSSTSSIDQTKPENSKFKGSVKTKTLESGNFLRNWSLKGGKYFDVDTYPTISFESTSVTANTNGFEVTGQLTIKDTTKKISIVFKRQDGRLVGTTTLFSSDFGINVIKKGREANKVIVRLSFAVK